MKRKSPLSVFTARGVLALTALVTSPALADVTFNPTRPPICPSKEFWLLPFRSEEFPEGPSGEYKDETHHTRHFVANGWTSQATLRQIAFDTEQDYDFVNLGTASNPTQHVLSGTPTGDRTVISSNSFASDPGKFSWDTDSSVQRPGFTFDAVYVCSSSSLTAVDTATAYFGAFPRVNGVLRAKDDVVYLRTGQLWGIDHLGITLRKSVDYGADFDLYVRCGAMPTPTNWDFRGFSYNTEEFVDVTCPLNQTIYIAVHAYAGGGSFALNIDPHWASGHRKLKAGTESVLSAADLDNVYTGLQKGARVTYGATEGLLIIDQIDLYNSGNCNNCGGSACDVCMQNSTGRSNAYLCTSATKPGRVNMKKNAWSSPEVYAHEWGHALFCCNDEYDEPVKDVAYSQCGHSIMAEVESAADHPPLTEGDGQVHNICFSANHTNNPHPPARPTNLPNCQQQAKNAGVIPVTWANPGDNYSMVDVDFNYAVGNVVVH